MKTNILTWGKSYKWYCKNLKRIKLMAYHKAFYFDNVYLNRVKITRQF